MPIYQPSILDNIEDIAAYRKGGFHPTHIGDQFDNGRYRIFHKLGYGGLSTVWLARDEARKQLVSLKILTAEASSRRCSELEIFREIGNGSTNYPGRHYVMSILDHFYFDGPNGSHLCLVSEFAGPSIRQMSFAPGKAAGSRRLRWDIAHNFARQTTEAVGFLHAAGIVHGGAIDLLFHIEHLGL